MPQTHAPRTDGARDLGQAPRGTAAELRAATAARLRGAHRAGARRARLVVCVLVLMLLALLAASLLLGGVKRIPAGDVLPAAFGLRTGLADYVIFRIRMPRALAALLAGALFGLSGALYQRLIRNPLATPDIVGISAGAGAGATTMLLFAPAVAFGTSLAGLGGAFALVATVLALSRRGGGVDTYRLVLVGIGLSAVCTAYVNYLFTVAGQHGIAQVMRWLVGSVNDATWEGCPRWRAHSPCAGSAPRCWAAPWAAWPSVTSSPSDSAPGWAPSGSRPCWSGPPPPRSPPASRARSDSSR